MFGQDNTNDDTNTVVGGGSGLPFDASSVSLGSPSDQAAPSPSTPVSSLDTATPSSPAPSAPTDNDEHGLLGIKQQALQQLSPLVGHLDQSPEEKFRTTMMMIQASDDQSLIKDAYSAAQAITDDKTRAQALLDIINEINYFTQQHQD